MCDGITYPFQNLNGCTGMYMLFHPVLYCTCDDLPMLGLQINHVNKKGNVGVMSGMFWKKYGNLLTYDA